MNRGFQPREVSQVEKKPHCISSVYFHVCVYHNILILIFLMFLRYLMMLLFKGEKSLYYTCSTNMSSFMLKIIFTMYFFTY